MFFRDDNHVYCGQCHWGGTLDGVVIELANDSVAHRCPDCQQLLRIPEYLSPCQRRNDRPDAGFDAPAESSFSGICIPCF